MAIGRTTVRLALVAALLVSAGCTSRGGRFPLARLMTGSRPNSANAATDSERVLPKYDKNQLLAAARQYEKEGRKDQADLYYRQVLAVDPQNSEARQGLQIVRSGEQRDGMTIEDLIAASRNESSSSPVGPDNAPDSQTESNVELARLLAEASAQREAITSSQQPSSVTPVSATIPETDDSSSNVAVCELDAPKSKPPTAYPLSPRPSRPVKRKFAPTLSELISKAPASPPAVEPAAEAPLAETEVTLDVVDATELEDPADWSDESQWHARSVSNLCQDANAAVLREVAKLDSEDAEIRKEGLWSLAEMGADAKSAADAVGILLDDENETVRAHAAWATWELTRDANPAVQSLVQLVGSSQADVVQFAAFTLANMGEQARHAVPALRQQLEHPNSLVRLHVAEALVRIGTPSDQASASKALVLLSTKGDTQVRMLSLMALGETAQVPTPETATAITQALHDSDAEVRSTAALTLGSFGKAAESAIAQLEFVANNDEQSVREAATTAIACIRE